MYETLIKYKVAMLKRKQTFVAGMNTPDGEEHGVSNLRDMAVITSYHKRFDLLLFCRLVGLKE